MNARQRFVEYIEFVGQNEDVGAILDIEGRHLSFVEFYNLDATALIFVIFVLISWFVCKIGRFIVSLLLRKCRKIKGD